MKIVLDSNIIIADFWLESTNFKILFENVKNGNIEIYIPEIVIDEVKNKFRQRLNQSRKLVETELIKFNKIAKKNISSILKDEVVSDSIIEYIEHLEKLIAKNDIKILSYPKTSHNFIAKKAILKLKPFNINEKGYRDCLIWENIKDLLTKEEIVLPELIFVTNNYKDFSEKDSYKLHQNLVSELLDRGFASNSVVVYPSLGEYNDKQGKIFLEQATTFEENLEEGKFRNFDLVKITSEFLFEKFRTFFHIHLYIDGFDEFNEPTVRSIDDDYEIKICLVKKISDENYLIDVEFEVETEIEYYIGRYEDGPPIAASSISVYDSDWNRHVMQMGAIMNLTMSMTIVVDSTLSLISCEINKINETYVQ